MPEEPKKMALLRILQILTKYSDADHLMTHQDIIEKLNELYNISLERKAVATNVSLLKEADYDIITTRKGMYLEGRVFNDAELHFLIDSVRGNQFMRSTYTNEIMEKLLGFSNKYFNANLNDLKLGQEQSGDNCELFMNIEAIYKAMGNGVNIEYDYNNYGMDKKLHKTSSYTSSPYKLLMHNHGYYLLAYTLDHEDLVFHRVDRMSNVRLTKERLTPITEIPDLGGRRLTTFLEGSRPYLYSDQPEKIEMIVSNYGNMISQLVDWLGKGIDIKDAGDEYGSLRVEVLASPQAMKYWAKQYSGLVEIISPPYLRDEIREELMYAIKKYENC